MSTAGENNMNEEFLMNLMVGGVQKDGLSVPQHDNNLELDQDESKKGRDEKQSISREKGKRKTAEADYESIFLKRSETNARDGKTVYIRPEFHEKLSRIVHVIGQDKITIYGYMNNLLEHHFSEFGDQIIKSFNDKYKPIL